MKKIKNIVMQYGLLGMVSLVFLYNLLHIFVLIKERGLSFVDFYARWQENAYLLHGINPFEARGINILDNIGSIGENMITVPWAWIIGIFINPGFMPYKYAKIWGLFVLISILITCMIVVYQYAGEKLSLDKVGRWTFVMLIGSSLHWWFSIYCGNNGMVAALLLIIAIFIYDSHPIIAGGVLTLAMVKPQLTAVFYVVLLIKRKFVPIAVSAVLGGVSMVIVSMLTGVSPLILIKQTTDASGVLSDTYIGFFDMLRYYGLPLDLTLYLDILLGVCFLCACTYIMFMQKVEEPLICFTVPAVMQSFWFYKQSHDNIIICVLMMGFALLFYRTKKIKIKSICVGCIALMIGSFYLSNIVDIIAKTQSIVVSTEQLRSLYRTLEVLLFIFMEFLLLYLIGNVKESKL